MPYRAPPAQDYPAETPQSYSDPAQTYAEDPNARYQDSDPRYAAAPSARYAAQQPAHQQWPGTPAPPPFYPPNDPLGLPSDQYAPQPRRSYDSRGYAAPGYPTITEPGPHDHYAPATQRRSYRPESAAAIAAGYQHSCRAAASRPAMQAAIRPMRPAGYPDAGYPAAPDRQGYPPPLYPQEPDAGSMPPPHDDEFYDDAPRGGRRKGLLTVAAVLALAVIGTAGAFGYRSLFGGFGRAVAAAGDPRQRRAEQGCPAAGHARPVGRQVQLRPLRRRRQGRAGGAARGEAGRSGAGRCRRARCSRARRSPMRRPANRPVAPGTTATANPPSAIGEPRRVRTVPIRPDQARYRRGCRSLPPRRRAVDVGCAAAPADAATPRRRSRAPPPAPLRANAPLSLSPDANSLPPPAAQDSAPPPRVTARADRVRAGRRAAAAIWCRCRRSGARPTRRTPIAASSRSIPSVLGSQPHTDPPRRSRQQGHLLPRHGRPVRAAATRRCSFAPA